MILKQTHQLENGDRLSRVEFERLCQLHDIERAELINGVVHMAAAVRDRQQGAPHARIMLWLGAYAMHRSNVQCADNVSLRLDDRNEPQPDAVLFLDNGNCHIDEDGYLSGSPELVVEVAASSVSIDAHLKKDLYLRSGVREYLLWRTEDETIDWWQAQNGVYQSISQNSGGVIASQQFQGLVLDTRAMLAGNMKQVLNQLPPIDNP